MVAISSARVVMVIPPKQWFGGHDRTGTLAVSLDLQRRFGSTFYHFDTTPFIFGDKRKQQDAIASLREYKPHLAIAPANYGLQSAVKTESGTLNVFTDILEIPLMMLWDHGLFGFPSQILSPMAETPKESCEGSLRRISQVIDQPLMCHYPIDSAQVSEMRRIGMLHSDNVHTVPPVAYKPFLDFGEKLQSRHYINDVGFVGNILLSERYQAKIDSSIGGRCHEAVVAGKIANPTIPAWTLLTEQVAALSASEKAESRLDYDQSYFWHFANEVVGVQCNTHSRMQTLTGIKRNVAFYGAFVDPEGIPRLNESGSIEYKGYAHFANELPQVYAGTRILVDVTNAAFISNCSTKPICCFASGGFSLFDYKPDPIKHFGSDIERVMFKSFDELNAKIDYFLTHEREREALADHLKDLIQRTSDFTNSVYDPAVQILAERAGTGTWSALREVGSRIFNGIAGDPPLVQVSEDPDKPHGPAQRLPDVLRPLVYPNWAGARVLSEQPMQIRTAESTWGNSALFPVAKYDPADNTRGALWLQVEVRAVSGSGSLGVFLKDNEVTEHRVITEDDGLRMLFFPLPRKGLRGLLIRSTDAPSAILEFTDIALIAEEAPRRSALNELRSRLFRRPARDEANTRVTGEERVGPVGATRRLAAKFALPDVPPYWPSAKLLSSSPVRIRTVDSVWGYSALVAVPKYAPPAAPGSLWLQITVRMISGRAGLGLLLDDDLVGEHIIGIEDGLSTLFFPLPAAEVQGLIIRSAEVPSSVIEINDIAVVAEKASRRPKIQVP